MQSFGEMISGNFGIGILLAFVAGILTVFTPCSLSSIPLIVAYVGGAGLKKPPKEADKKEQSAVKRKAFLYSIFICIGQTVVFVALGLAAASLGKLMGIGGFGKIWNGILIALMIWMSLEMFGITNVLSRGTGAVNKVTQKGIIGALLVGMAGALFSTPCSTPVLTAMLAYASTSGAGILSGGLLLLSYSLGHSILLVVAGTSIGFVESLSGSGKFAKVSVVVKVILGLLMLALAGYLIYNTFFV